MRRISAVRKLPSRSERDSIWARLLGEEKKVVSGPSCT